MGGLKKSNGWLGYGEAVPQRPFFWGTVSLCPSQPLAHFKKSLLNKLPGKQFVYYNRSLIHGKWPPPSGSSSQAPQNTTPFGRRNTSVAGFARIQMDFRSRAEFL